MPKIVYADMLPIPGRGRICSVVLDEWPEGLKTGDRLLVGGIEFDYEIEHLSFRGPVDLRPHLALMLRDEEIGLFGGFCGRDSGIGPAQQAKTTIWN